MVIDKNTRLCISVSSNPGTTGSRIHNHLYEKYELDCIYKPFVSDNIREVMQAVRILGIRGCGVSMPFKTGVIHYLDDIEKHAQLASSVNTVVNDDGRLTGYNTDIAGARMAIEDLCSEKPKTATIFGAGATAHSVCIALDQLGVEEVKIRNRTVNRAWSLKRFIDDELTMNAHVIHGDKPDSSDILVNCTSIGMHDGDVFPLEYWDLGQYRHVMDVVNRDTDLVNAAARHVDPACICNGRHMAVYQSLLQFQLYTEMSLNIRSECMQLLGERIV